jgi:hypothetical protein
MRLTYYPRKVLSRDIPPPPPPFFPPFSCCGFFSCGGFSCGGFSLPFPLAVASVSTLGAGTDGVGSPAFVGTP